MKLAREAIEASGAEIVFCAKPKNLQPLCPDQRPQAIRREKAEDLD
jgi:hypothetical protein